MNKILKYTLLGLLVILISATGAVYYFFNTKSYDMEDEVVKEINESGFEIVLPEGIDLKALGLEQFNAPKVVTQEKSNSNPGKLTSIMESEDKIKEQPKYTSTNNVKPTESVAAVKVNKNPEAETNNSNGEIKNSEPTIEQSTKTKDKQKVEPATETTPVVIKETAEEIIEKYKPVFQSLESQANSKIDALLSRAIGEYQAKKGSGESISYSYFYQKYNSAGRELESNTDAAFNYVYSVLEKELEVKGFDPGQAHTVKTSYYAAKKQREASLINLAKQAL
jgi:hypothetical protein